MKTLIVVRHARAVAGSPHMRDFDRDLTPDGAVDAKSIGRWLQVHTAVPDLMLASSSARTKATAILLAEAYGVPASGIELSDDLYETSVQTAVDQIHWHSTPEMQSIMIVGHNPTVTVLAGMVSEDVVEALPTAAAVVIDFNDDVPWNRLQKGRVRQVVTPKSLSNAD